jgi:hypothetical protein
MKRTFTDGQFTIIRKSPWLIQVIIEGPFGERAGNAFVHWLTDLYALYGATQYILLNASNIGPIKIEVLQKLVVIFLQEELAGFAIFGGVIAQQQFQGLLELLPDNQIVAFGDNEREATQFLDRLYKIKNANV